MTIDEALIVLDSILGQEQLTHLQETVFRRSWEGQTYDQIATSEDYDPDYVKLVGSQLWQLLSEQLGQRVSKNNFRVVLRQWMQRTEEKPQHSALSTQHSPSPLQDWGEATDVSSFCGRSPELDDLQNWIVKENARLVAILGMGGIGKTSLSIKLAQRLVVEHSALSTQHSALAPFEFVIWRSLRDAPPMDVILADLIQFFSRQQETELPDTVDGKLTRLMHYLRSSRCLIVLDNVETILGGSDRAGHYPIGYESYGELFRRIGETMHQSCLVITSREKPREVAALEGGVVRSLRLTGLDEAEANELLKPKQLEASDRAFKQLIKMYAGNPLALKIAGATIQELFAGDVSEFLTQGTAVFGDIYDLLDEQFDRLSAIEKQIMYWLAIDREGVSLSQLAEDILPTVSRRELIEALAVLARRPIVEKQGASFTQQPVVMEYVINKLIDQMYSELTSGSFNLLMSHALMKATAEDYLRQTQSRLILQPLLAKLISKAHSQSDLEEHFQRVLMQLREQFGNAPGYAAGNVLNLLCSLKADLTGYDFSGLCIWQANLQGIDLHLVNFSDSDLRKSVFSDTLKTVWSVAFHPEGSIVAATDTAGLIHLWRLSDGQKILTCEGHQHWVCDVEFSSDGKMLASASGDYTAKVWNAKTGECLHTLSGHSDWVISVAISPSNLILASSSSDRTIRIWDLKTGECLRILEGHQHWVCKVTFSPDGTLLASASDDRTLKLWNVETGACLKTLEGHASTVRGIAFNPNGNMLVSSSEDGTIKLWEIETSMCLKTLKGHLDEVRCVEFSPDGGAIASSSSDETIKLWDVETGKCLRTLHQHRAAVRSVKFSPDGEFLVSGGVDETVRLWRTDTGECCKTLQGYTNFVLAAIVSPNDRWIASTSTDQTVTLWDRHSGERLKTLYGHTNWMWSAAFTPDSQFLASGCVDHTIRIWNSVSGECLKVLRGHTNWVMSVSFSPNDDIVASGSFDQTIRLWNFRSGSCLRILKTQSRIWSIAYSPDGEILASGEEDHTIHLWNPHTGQCLQTLQGHTNRVLAIAFSRDGKQLLSGSEDRTLRIWDLKTGQCLQVLQDSDRVASVAFFGEIIASAGTDQTVKLWDFKSGECREILKGHSDRVWSVSLSSDGQTLVSGSEDETIRVWDLKTGQCEQVLRKPKPYDGMNITNVNGITDAQKTTLKMLGAIEL